MHYPLTLPRILDRARTSFPRKGIVTRVPGGVQRHSYRELYERSCRLAGALQGLGVKPGERVATCAWNTHRHMEAYWAVPSMGGVLHTVNIRLSPDDLAHIINHAQDVALLVDEDLAPLIAAITDRLETVRHIIVMGDGDNASSAGLPSAHPYEELLAQASPPYQFPELDEWAPAGLCYTSATTGRAKGVIYNHRAIYLHTMMQCMTDFIALSERDVVMAVVPMFHVNCWGTPFSCTMLGADQVLPGVRPDPKAICELIQAERVTVAMGVPTIWIGVLDFLERSAEKYDLKSLRLILSGGAAVPASLIEAYDRVHGVRLVQAYGMTEASPLVAISNLKSHMDSLSDDQKLAVKSKQGLVVPGLEMKLVDEGGKTLPWDGKQRGELLLRGPWIASEYYDDPRTAESFRNGWYHTGDIANVDEEGYIQIVDRARDVIRSGGEWISSVDLEAAIMSHSGVLEAAVIAVPHPHWQERPLACVVPKAEAEGTLTPEDVLAHLQGRFARWWLPDDVVFLEEIPKTSVGKYDKVALRHRFRDSLSSP